MKELLMERLHCNERQAEKTASSLSKLSDSLRPVLEQWLKDGAFDGNQAVEGYSLNALMKDYHMQFTGALLTMDWLLKEPAAAKKALSRGIK